MNYLLNKCGTAFSFYPLSQESPTISPWSVISIASAAGCVGNPGMVMISPQKTTTKPAPELSDTSVTIRVKFLGLPRASSSPESEYWVFAIQIGKK